MNTKDATILLIFLLAVMGLIIGVYYTESADIEKTHENSGEIIFEDVNGTITITLEPKEKTGNFLDGIFS